MEKILASELVLNADGSIYHLNIRKEHLASTIFFVGNPDRVPMVSKYFDSIEHKIQKREFVTHTGYLGGKRLSVISTGIGPDNIDIVLNELDALVNFDLEEKTVKSELTPLNIIRLGTSGSLHKDIPVNSVVASRGGLGFDNVMHFYQHENNASEKEIEEAFANHIPSSFPSKPYYYHSDSNLIDKLAGDLVKGITATCPGFYGPQGRKLRGQPAYANFLDIISSFHYKDYRISNFEMETSTICGLSSMLGHNALSFNTILANRPLGEFSTTPKKAVDDMIQLVLERVVNL